MITSGCDYFIDYSFSDAAISGCVHFFGCDYFIDYFWMQLLLDASTSLDVTISLTTSGCDYFWMRQFLDVTTSGCDFFIDYFWIQLLLDASTSLDVTISLTTSVKSQELNLHLEP